MSNRFLEDAALERANRIFNNLPATSQNKDHVETDMGTVFRGWGLDPEGYWIGMWVYRHVARAIHFQYLNGGLGEGINPQTGGGYTLDEVKAILASDCQSACTALGQEGLLEEDAFKP